MRQMEAADWAGSADGLSVEETEVLQLFKRLLTCRLWCAGCRSVQAR